MDSSDKDVLKQWADLKQGDRLPPDLDVEPERILQSEGLRARVLALAAFVKNEKREAHARWTQAQSKQRPLEQIVDNALSRVESVARAAAGIPSLRVGHLGAIGIDRKHLFIYFIAPGRKDVSQLVTDGSADQLKRQTISELRNEGYDTSVLTDSSFGFFSQEECDEVAGGNWYHFFK